MALPRLPQIAHKPHPAPKPPPRPKSPKAMVKMALKKASNSSPVAREAFKRAAPAVKAAKPHLQALAQQGGKGGLLSSLRHGVAAMRSLRQVTHEMAKLSPATMPPHAAASKPASKSASKHAPKHAPASPEMLAAFHRAGPATAKAQHHAQALHRLQQQGGSHLFSSMVHGIQALHAMRSVTKELSKTPTARLSSVDAALNATKAESPVAARAFEHAAPAVARARTHIERLTLNAQRPSPSLLSSMVQGVQALRALRGVTHAMKSAPRGSAMGHTHAPASPSMRPGPADSAMATAPQGPGEHSLSTFPTQGA